MKHTQNNQKPTGKFITAYRFKKLKKKIHESKVSRLLPNVCNFQIESSDFGKENYTPGNGFKNLYTCRKSIA
jgi:hypothetical protein